MTPGVSVTALVTFFSFDTLLYGHRGIEGGFLKSSSCVRYRRMLVWRNGSATDL